MDMQLTVKIIHMSIVALLIGVVIARAFTLFVGVQGNQPNPVARKTLGGTSTFVNDLNYIDWCNLFSN